MAELANSQGDSALSEATCADKEGPSNGKLVICGQRRGISHELGQNG